MIRQSILKQVKDHLVEEAYEVRKMRERIKRWIMLGAVKDVVFRGKLNFDKLFKKKEHEKYRQKCSKMIYRNFRHFLHRKSPSIGKRRQQVCR